MIQELSRLAESDAAAAREHAWAWMHELIHPPRGQRRGAAARLERVFQAGGQPEVPDGLCEAILTPAFHPLLDPIGRAALAVWTPLQGKEFFPAQGRGHNVFDAGARFLSRLIWPRYRPRPHPRGRAALEFEARIEPGAADPDLEVLVCDYTVVADSPFLIRKARDEYRQIVPGVWLGKGILRTRGGSQRLIGYEALRAVEGA